MGITIEELIKKLKADFDSEMQVVRTHNYVWTSRAEILEATIKFLDRQPQLEAENIALIKLLCSANDALKRLGSKTRFVMHSTIHNNCGPVFKEKELPEDVYAKQEGIK